MRRQREDDPRPRLPPRSPDTHPRDRASDRGTWAVVKAHYRDFWLLVISGLCLLATIKASDAVHDVQVGRHDAIVQSCRNDQAQDNVLRALVTAGLEQDREQHPHDAVRLKVATAFAERLLKPLGGLVLTPAESQALCAHRIRVARATG